MSIEVNPIALRAAASSIDDATASALENVKNSLTPSHTAAADHPGWASSAGLDACRQAWLDHLTDLVRRTAEAAEKLRDSATDYQELERRTTEAIESIHWEAE